MKRLFLYLIIFALPVLFTACDVHEWPDVQASVTLHLKLSYEKDMTVWKHLYDNAEVTGQGLGDTYANSREHGRARYIIRAYPLTAGQSPTRKPARELVFTRDIADGYDCDVTFDIAPGDYHLMVWSDFVENAGDTPFYNADNFAEITLQGLHAGNNDYRDCFRGTSDISLKADINEADSAAAFEITMQRPVAKLEVITTDLAEFMEKEATRIAAKNSDTQSSAGAKPQTIVNTNDYEVVFKYIGFMPDTYSMFTDKPVDSSTGVMFKSTLKKLNAGEASMGFDYVFVNGTETAATVQIGLYDKDGTLLSLTEQIKVPLKRNRHTVLRGRFLMSKASGGITINPDYDGDHNIIFP